jgi:hypothetical protein
MRYFLIIGSFCLLSTMIACKGDSSKDSGNSDAPSENSQPADSSAVAPGSAPAGQSADQYQCPMKCTEEVFTKPGTCPVCKMDLEKVSKS